MGFLQNQAVGILVNSNIQSSTIETPKQTEVDEFRLLSKYTREGKKLRIVKFLESKFAIKSLTIDNPGWFFIRESDN